MELKLVFPCRRAVGGTCSNRTFMELKWTNDVAPGNENMSSNRTFMELKFADF